MTQLNIPNNLLKDFVQMFHYRLLILTDDILMYVIQLVKE